MGGKRTYGFETLQVHAGMQPEPATGARQTPIYLSTAYVFKDVDQAAALFDLKEIGFIYSRLTNPTVATLSERIATLEGGVGAVSVSSGHAAQIVALFPLMGPGKNIVASTRLYGGSVTQLSQTIRRFDWSTRFVDFDDPDAIRAAIDDDTRALFCESLANPTGHPTDLDAVARVAEDAGLPLIVDNTSATPYLCRPFEHGASIVVHSATKYLTGNGTVTAGAVMDSGTFDWSASGKFPLLSDPNPAYHGLRFHETFGHFAYVLNLTAVVLRDLGATLNPQAAHYALLGLETLSLRMERHVANAMAVAEWLEAHPKVASVSYGGLPSAGQAERLRRLYPRGAGAIFTVRLKGGFEACTRVIDAFGLISHVANLGDARTLAIHPASTTHRQLSDSQRRAAGINPGEFRLSIGLEDPADIVADLEQALDLV